MHCVQTATSGNHHFPFQSVYKFHLGIAVLHQVDLYSPIKDKYPNGLPLPLREVITYTLAQSDNVGCDIACSTVRRYPIAYNLSKMFHFISDRV